jgi:hypothetical protein
MAEQKTSPIGRFFLLNNNAHPAFWGNPIVPVYFDESGEHQHILDRARAFAAFYAMASEEAPLGSLAGGMFENANNTPPTLGLVVADYRVENGKLASPLKEKLQAAWGNTPVSAVVSENIALYWVGGVTEGSFCSLLEKGEVVGDANTAYRVDSVVILAQTSLSEEDILLCFQNKIAMMFGLAPALFDQERTWGERISKPAQFSLFPHLLVRSPRCRRVQPKAVLECIEDGMRQSHENLLNVIKGEQ